MMHFKPKALHSDLSSHELLTKLLEYELNEYVTDAFTKMLAKVNRGLDLTVGERNWAIRMLDEREPQAQNLWSRGLVPKGRDVATPEVLKNLPLKPPHRRHEKP
jgi:hypothetical protein